MYSYSYCVSQSYTQKKTPVFLHITNKFSVCLTIIENQDPNVLGDPTFLMTFRTVAVAAGYYYRVPWS